MADRDTDTISFGRYEILERVGTGGMAEVYLARAYGTDGFVKDLVLKKILDNHSDDVKFRKMFIDEAKITVGLTHTNIVQVFDFGKVDHTYFLAMERVHGVDLRALIKAAREKKQKMPVAVALYIVAEVLKGLDYAHRRTDSGGSPLGIVHRDVSPSNVLLSFEGEVKVADFGIARAAGQAAAAAPGHVIGKPRYMSPEQLRDEDVDARADVFACGCVLFELLVGYPPFASDGDKETIDRVLDELPPRAPSIAGKDVPMQIDPIVMRALQPERRNRWNSAAAFHDAIQDFSLDHRIRLSGAALADMIRSCVPPETATAAAPRERHATREVTIFKKASTGEGMAQFHSEVDRGAHTEYDSRFPTTPGPDAIGPSVGLIPQASPRRSRVPFALGAIVLLGGGGVGSAFGIRAMLDRENQTPTPTALVATPSAASTTAIVEASPIVTATPVATPTRLAMLPSPIPSKKHPTATPNIIATSTPPVVVATPPRAAPGKLTFNTTPPAQVFIDRVPQKAADGSPLFTPLFNFPIPSGTHEIEVVEPDSKKRHRFTVTIKEGETLNARGINFALLPGP